MVSTNTLWCPCKLTCVWYWSLLLYQWPSLTGRIIYSVMIITVAELLDTCSYLHSSGISLLGCSSSCIRSVSIAWLPRTHTLFSPAAAPPHCDHFVHSVDYHLVESASSLRRPLKTPYPPRFQASVCTSHTYLLWTRPAMEAALRISLRRAVELDTAKRLFRVRWYAHDQGIQNLLRSVIESRMSVKHLVTAPLYRSLGLSVQLETRW